MVRNLSDNSIRGYVTDLESFLKHMSKLGIVEFNQLEIEHIRSWLANLQSTGVARSTLTRRIVSIRAFTNWAAANGWLNSDLGANLAVPKPHKVLPEVLNVEEAITVLKALEVKSVEEPSALNIRDLALVEVLYGSGIRVSELCGLGIARFAPKSEVNQPLAAAQFVKARIETILLVKVALATPVLCRLASQDRICSISN